MKAEGENEIFNEEQIFKQSAENLPGGILAKEKITEFVFRYFF